MTQRSIRFGGPAGLVATLTFVLFAGPTVARGDGGPDAAGYGWRQVEASFDSMAVATPVVFDSDDSFSGPVEIGFSFVFYGVSRPVAYIGSNGIIAFAPNQVPVVGVGLPPNEASPNGFVAGYGDLLFPVSGFGDVRYATLGEIPNRRFVVDYDGVSLWSDDGEPSTVSFQIALFEGSNEIEVRHRAPLPDRVSGVVGIESHDGRAGLVVPSDAVDPLGAAYRFSSAGFDRDPPTAFDLLTPVDGSVHGTEVRLDWGDATDAGAVSYDVYFGSTRVATTPPDQSEAVVSALRALGSFSLRDDFDTGALDETIWDPDATNTAPSALGLSEPSPSFSLQVHGGAVATSHALDLATAVAGSVRYAWQHTGGGNAPENGDDLIVELFDGARWVELGRHTRAEGSAVTYTAAVHALPPETFHGSFRMRFRANGGAGGDHYFVDDFELELVPSDPLCGPFEWYVVARDAAGRSTRSGQTWSVELQPFDAYGAPAPRLVAPIGAVGACDTGVELSWANDGETRGVSYDVFVNGQAVATGLGSTEVRLADSPVFAGENDWYVVARSCAGDVTSAVASFSADTVVVPQMATPVAPAHNAVVYCDPTIEWTYPGPVEGVRFDVVTTSGEIVAAGLEDTRWTPETDADRLESGRYTYRIVARNCAGQRAASAARSIIVNNTPIAPVLVAPADGEVVGPAPAFAWEVLGPEASDVTYALYVDGDEDMPLASGLTVPAFALPAWAQLAAGDHTWQVVAEGCLGAAAPSGWRTFTVDAAGPQPLALVAPVAETWFPTFDVDIPFEWEPSSDALAGVGAYVVRIDGETVASVDAGTTRYVREYYDDYLDPRTYTTSFESAEGIWSLAGQWRRWTSSSSRTGASFLNSDDGGDYARNRNDSATWQGWPDLVLAPGARLRFYLDVHEIDYGDTLYIEASFDGGSWERIAAYAGRRTNWGGYRRQDFDLSAHVGQAMRFRFRFYTDNSYVDGGFTIDDVSVGPLATHVFSVPLTEGLHTWGVLAVDAVGNATDATGAGTFGLDFEPPGPFELVAPEPDDATREGRPTFSWTESTDALSGVERYELVIDDAVASTDSAMTAMPTDPLVDGLHAWRVDAIDRAGHRRASSGTRELVVDRAPPPSVILVDVGPRGAGDWVASDIPRFEFDASDGDDGSGIVSYELFIDGASYGGPPIAAGDGHCWPNTCVLAFDPLAEGEHEWHVVAFDRVGLSTQSETGSFRVEALPPADFQHTSPGNGATVPTFSPLLCWRASGDDGSGLDEYRVELRRAGAVNVSLAVDALPGREEICARPDAPLPNGSYSWLVTAIDHAGNTTAANFGASWTMTVDQDDTPPLSQVGEPAGDGALVGCTALTLTGSASDPGPTPTSPPGSGVKWVQIQVDGTESDAWLPATVGGDANMRVRPWSWTWEEPTTGTHTVWVRSIDLEDNIEVDPVARVVDVDCDGPEAFGLGEPAEGAYADPCPAFTWTAAQDHPAGVARYALRVRPADGGDERVFDVGAATSIQLDGDDCLAAGTHIWTVAAYDTLDNPGGAASTRTLHVDTTGPVGFPIVAQAPLGPDGWGCNDRRITVGWSATADTGPNTGVGLDARPYQVYLDGAAHGGRRAELERTFTGLADGRHTWSVRAFDALGNWTDATIVEPLGAFRIDCTPPPSAETVSLRLTANDVPTHPARHQSEPLDTGLVVTAGEEIRVEAHGELCFTDDKSCDPALRASGFCMGPEGNDAIIGTFSKFFAPYRYGRVLAMLAGEEASPFDVGSGARLHAPRAGRLLLAVNDDDDYNCRSKWHDVTLQRTHGFNLLLPADGVVSAEVQPTLRWSAVVDDGIGVDRLELLVDGQVVEGNLPPDAIAFELPATAALTEADHTWQVRAHDRLGNVGHSDTWSIITDLTGPEPFDVTTPVEGDVVRSVTPEMCWTPTVDTRSAVAHYLLFVDDAYNTAAYASERCQGPAAPLGEGQHCFEVTARDELRHERTSTSRRCFVVDTQPPEPFDLDSPPPGFESHTARPAFCWQTTVDRGTGVSEYELWLSGSRLATIDAPIAPIAPVETMCWTPEAPLQNGAYDWFVRAVDDAGAGGGRPGTTQTEAWPIVIDRDVTPPTVVFVEPAPGELSGARVEVRGTVDDGPDGTGIASFEIGEAGAPDSWQSVEFDAETGAWATSWSFDRDGDATLCARSWDHEGNGHTPPGGPRPYPCRTFRIDVSPPLPFALLGPADGEWVSSRPTLRWQETSDSPAGVAHYHIFIDGGPATDAGIRTEYELGPAEALADGPHTWTVNAVDALGNERAASAPRTIRVDGQPPAPVELIAPANSVWTNTGRPELCWAPGEDAGGSGLARYRVRVDGIESFVTADTVCYIPPRSLTGGSHSWDVAAFDTAGNAGPVSPSRTVRVDVAAPPAPAPTYPDDGMHVRENPPIFRWTQVTDPPPVESSGICGYVIELDGVEHGAAAADNRATWPEPIADGDAVWTIRAVDCAGNRGAASAPRRLRLDTEAPGPAALRTPLAEAWAPNPRPVIEWGAASDADSGIAGYVVILDDRELELASEVTAYTPDSDLADGQHTVTIVAVDGAGNRGPIRTRRFGVDTEPPAPVGLESPDEGTCVAERQPTVAWAPCADAVSGIGGVVVLVDGAVVTDPPLGTDATSYEPVRPLTDGPHTWAIRCVDRAGHATDSAPASLTVDVEPATCRVLEIAPSEDAEGIYVATGRADDAGCGVARVEVGLGERDWVAADTIATDDGIRWTAHWIPQAPAGRFELACRAIDLAGNAAAEIDRVTVQLDACNEAGPCDPVTRDCITPRPAGRPCDDGDPCTQVDTCLAGACIGTDRVQCPTLDECHDAGVCEPATGACRHPVAPDGRGCDDGDACTRRDICESGQCIGVEPMSCPGDGQCRLDGECDPETGRCQLEEAPDGQACDDGDACTASSACLTGECLGGAQIACDVPLPPQCADGMTVRRFEPAGICVDGGCVHTAIDAPCDSGGDSGSCIEDIGECLDGACRYQSRAAGADCDDGNACTVDDACDDEGICAGGAPVRCDDPPPPRCADAIVSVSGSITGRCVAGVCDYATQRTHCPRGCDAATGRCADVEDPCEAVECEHPPGPCHIRDGRCVDGLCDYEARPVGEACDDLDACTVGDTCDGFGSCRPGSVVVCDDPPGDTCEGPDSRLTHDAVGVCAEGLCLYPELVRHCPGGCADGLCHGATCDDEMCNTAPGPCFEPQGACDGGDCRYAPRPSEAPCEDGDPCTLGDLCDGRGHCAPGLPLRCDEPPGAGCVDDSTSRVFAAIGACDGESCGYDFEDVFCASGCVPETGRCLDDSCRDIVCDAPAEACRETPGTCRDGICEYLLAERATECDDEDACTLADACDGEGNCAGTTVNCDDPPPTECVDGDTSRAYDSTGQCADGECDYAHDDTLCAAGCDPATGECARQPVDAAPVDAAPADAAPADAAPADSAPADAGGLPDATPVDAATVDAAAFEDSDMPDAALPANTDAGPIGSLDADPLSGNSTHDAANEPATHPNRGDCSCHLGQDAPAQRTVALLAALAVAGLVRRRRRRIPAR